MAALYLAEALILTVALGLLASVALSHRRRLRRQARTAAAAATLLTSVEQVLQGAYEEVLAEGQAGFTAPPPAKIADSDERYFPF